MSDVITPSLDEILKKIDMIKEKIFPFISLTYNEQAKLYAWEQIARKKIIEKPYFWQIFMKWAFDYYNEFGSKSTEQDYKRAGLLFLDLAKNIIAQRGGPLIELLK